MVENELVINHYQPLVITNHYEPLLTAGNLIRSGFRQPLGRAVSGSACWLSQDWLASHPLEADWLLPCEPGWSITEWVWTQNFTIWLALIGIASGQRTHFWQLRFRLDANIECHSAKQFGSFMSGRRTQLPIWMPNTNPPFQFLISLHPLTHYLLSSSVSHKVISLITY